MLCDKVTRMRVGRGSWPPSLANIRSKIGTMNTMTAVPISNENAKTMAG